jgi:transcriptional regulator with XRE-family HTH domain
MLRLCIKELANERGINRNQLQLRSGVTLPLLTRYWNNETSAVTLDALEKIARALGVKAVDLFEEVPDSEPVGLEGKKYGYA